MPSRYFIHALALLALAWTTATSANTQPNIVLIMADDMGFECMSANGPSDYSTPNLDKLASQGVRFTHAHSTPVCTPTRVQIMSGLYNSRNYTRFGHMDSKITTFGNILKDAGYATCVVGKWQLNGGYSKPPTAGFEAPANFGFDEHCLWQLTRLGKNKPPRFANPGLEINGKEHDFKQGQYGPKILSDYACDFIKRKAKEQKPFLLYYPMILPHWPFEPTPDSDDWDPDYRKDQATEKLKRPQELTSLPHFVGMVAYTDKIVGKIVKQLEDSGVRDNTLIIFTGDNGVHYQITSTFNGKPYPGGKAKTTLNGTHVPFVVDLPGKAKAGSVCEELIDFTDILPTLLDAADADYPKGFKPDGRSFLPLVKGEPGNPREWVYCYYAPGKKEFAMTKRYKLYKSGKFFDLQQDFYEKSPIEPANRTDAQKQVAAKLKQAIDNHTRK